MRLILAAVALVMAVGPGWAADRLVDCRIVVKGRIYLAQKCNFSAIPDGSFSIGSGGESRTSFIAFVNKNPDGTAEAFWNESADKSYAQTSIGIVTQHGACWTNATAQICAR